MNNREIFSSKKQCQMSLRDHSHIKPKKFVEYDEQQEEKHIQSKSKRWWQKVNKRYFGTLTQNELLQHKNFIIDELHLIQQIIPFKQQSYYYRNLCSKNLKFFERKNIKVLFQHVVQDPEQENVYCYVSYNFVIMGDEQQQQMIQKQKQNQETEKLQENLSITCFSQMHEEISESNDINNQIEFLALQYTKSGNDSIFLNHALQYDLALGQYFPNQIDRELYLWNQQLKKLSRQNQNIWKQIFKNQNIEREQDQQNLMIQRILNGYKIDQDIEQMSNYLAWQHNLMNIKNGFNEKTEQMLAQILQGMWIKQYTSEQQVSQKKKILKSSLQNLIITKSQLTTNFQTDCKVCFSTYVSSKNQVIYCDRCNEGFHQKCYGVQNLSNDPNVKYYCDSCQYILEPKKSKKTKLQCEICHISFSPLKRFGQYCFHPSCLFFNNFLQPKLGALQLNKEPQTIIETIKTYETNNTLNFCQYCLDTCNKGLRYKCSDPQCNIHFHILCAYLNAAVFNTWREDKKLNFQITCRSHYSEQERTTQIYLRRFFCNYKQVSDLNQQQFIQIFRQQLQQIQEYQYEYRKKLTPSQLKHRRPYRKSHYHQITISSDSQYENTNQNNKQKLQKIQTQVPDSAISLKIQFQKYSTDHFINIPKNHQKSNKQLQELEKLDMCLKNMWKFNNISKNNQIQFIDVDQ